MRRLCAVLLAMCLAGAGATAASASTVTVTLDARFHDFNEVRYVAAPGEANDLDAHYAADARSVTVTDPGAVITAQGSCTSLSPHSAVCTAPNPPFPIAGEFVQSVRALLGDMNDRAVTSRTGPNVIGGIDAFGGPGDDRLIGSPTEDLLDGGGGTDVLTGGRGSDTLRDGDRDGAAAGLRPDRDTLSGGRGIDTLSYAQRTRGVVVDLARTRAGEPRERDRATGFENATGGRGDDRLAAAPRRGGSRLDGGAGGNVLVGRRGGDFLLHATGRRVLCGRGLDRVTRPRAHTLIPASCEELSVRAPRRAIVDSGATVRPTPSRRGGALGFVVSCPDLDGEPQDCRATVRIRSAGGRLLASGRLRGRPRDTRFLALHLTALGARLRGDGHRERATTTLRGRLMSRTSWTIAF